MDGLATEQYAVAIGVEPVTRRHRHLTQQQRNIPVANPLLIRFNRAHAECLNTDIYRIDDLDIANRADHHDPRPTIIRRQLSKTVTQQRSMQGTLPVHQQHPAFTRLSDGLGHPRVVGVAGYCGDRAGKAFASAKRAKLKAQMLGRRMGIR